MPTTTEKRTFRLTSNGLAHGPGMVTWIRHIYQDDEARAWDYAAATWPKLPAGTLRALLKGEATTTLEDDGDTLAVEEA